MADIKEKKYVSDNAQLMAEWDWERNMDVSPSQLTCGSNKKVWWKCNKSHEWSNTPNHRTSRNDGCPYCSNHRILKGFNDLATIAPELATEWNYEKNGELTPDITFHNSNKTVWWICRKGHEWEAQINHRRKGKGCPFCKKELATSYPEQIVFYYVSKLFPDAINRYVEKRKELDIYIPSLHLGIEYDGEYYHKIEDRPKEIEKETYFSRQNILVLRIKEGKNITHAYVKENMIFYSPNRSYTNIAEVLCILYSIICKYGHVFVPFEEFDIEKDNEAILQSYLSTQKNNSVETNPILAKEWNQEKNGQLIPEFFALNSGKKVWWVCENGHEWTASIANRNRGAGCPYCTSRKILIGYNDLQTRFPELATQWHPTKNGNLSPLNVTASSGKKAWWICNEGHEWQAVIQTRTKGAGCPYCSNQKAIAGFNDLKTELPEIAAQWHPTKNGDLKPDMFSCGSGKKIWWICENGHEWEAYIYHRAKGSECPYCSNHFASQGKNDLQTVNPAIANEWNYEKNDNLSPMEVLPKSDKRVWRKCSNGHEWQATISNRTKGNGCPYCSGRCAIKGENDLLTINPDLAKEWNHERNGRLTPSDVLPNSNKKAWWKCSNGHEWQATIAHRNRGQGCPYCSGRYAVKGENDLQTINPHLAQEWNYEKNDGLVPSEVLPNSNKKVWWLCSKGHEWQARINNRSNGNGCPECAQVKRKVSQNTE